MTDFFLFGVQRAGLARWKYIVPVLLGLAALFYLVLLPRFPVGHYNDDADYILAAQSILHPQTAEASKDHPLFVRSPGLPLLLAPFVAIVTPHWSLLKIIPCGLTLLSCLLFFRLFDGMLSYPERVLCLAFFAFNPTTAGLSGSVISEPAFTAGCLASFLLMRAINGLESPWLAVGLGVILAWTSLIRPEGVVILISVASGLAQQKRWRALTAAMAIALPTVLAYILWSYVAHGTVSSYLPLWQQSLTFLSPRGVLMNGWAQADTLFNQTLFAFPFAPVAEISIVGVVFGCFVGGKGLSTFMAQTSEQRMLGLGCATFCFLYFLSHMIWPVVDPRFYLPVLPYFLVFLVSGIRSLLHGTRALPPTVVALLLVTAVGYGYQDIFAIRQALHPTSSSQLPSLTIEWIKSHTAPNDRLLAANASVIRLYTRRPATAFIGGHTIEVFRFNVSQAGVSHVLCQPTDISSVPMSDENNLNVGWERICRWMTQWPGVFELEAQSPDDGARVFSVKQNDSYPAAYRLYLGALDRLNDNDFEGGVRKLRGALALYPEFPSALNALATALILRRQHLPEAETLLREATSIRPVNSMAVINLARLYARTGRTPAARALYQQALRDILPDPELVSLAPMVQKELSDLR